MYRVKNSARKLLLLSRGSAVLSKFAGNLTECENSLVKSNYNDPKGKVRGTHLLGFMAVVTTATLGCARLAQQ